MDFKNTKKKHVICDNLYIYLEMAFGIAVIMMPTQKKNVANAEKECVCSYGNTNSNVLINI